MCKRTSQFPLNSGGQPARPAAPLRNTCLALNRRFTMAGMPQEITTRLQDLPQNVVSGLSSFIDSAVAVYGTALKSVVLYGSGAEGRLRPASDVNLILVLASFDPVHANAIRAPYAVAQAAIRLTAMFLLQEEIGQAVALFGQKFSDIHRRHRVLLGDDPFANASVPRAAVVFRLKQVLLNLALRLREGYVERGSTPERIATLIADAAGPLRSCAATLLELEGKPGISPKEALISIAAGFPDGGWDDTLARVSDAREERELPVALADQTLFRMMELASRLKARVDALE